MKSQYLKIKCLSIAFTSCALISKTYAEEAWQKPFVEVSAQIDERLRTALCISKAHEAMVIYKKSIDILNAVSLEVGEKNVLQRFEEVQWSRHDIWVKFDSLLAIGRTLEPKGADFFTSDMKSVKGKVDEVYEDIKKNLRAEADFLAYLAVAKRNMARPSEFSRNARG